jgi:serine protease Do
MRRWSLASLALVVGLTGGTYLAGTWSLGQNPPPANSTPAATGIPKELTSYRNVVKRVLPAVVSIEARTKVVRARDDERMQQRAPLPFDDSQIPEEFRKFFDDFRRFPSQSPTVPAPRVGYGSGFFVDAAGVVVTNNHVVEGADSVVVETQDGKKYTSHKWHRDPRTDLAVVILDVKGTQFPYLELGDSDQMEIGDRVLAVGAPFGLAGSVTHGIVSGKGRNGFHMNMYEDFIQTDAPINPGNSGGPLVSLDGKVIGINAAIKSRSGGFQGVGLAVASNLAKNVINSLRTEGVVHRGYLGVQIRELDPDVASRLNVPKGTGVLVADVFDKTPASKAGLKAGDVLTSVAGKPVHDGKALQYAVAGLPIGKAAAVEYVRDGQKHTAQVTIEEQPAQFGTETAPAPRAPRGETSAVPLDKIGIEVSDLTPSLANDFGYRKGATGAAITKVQPGSLAAEAGLRRGMLIRKVDNKAVTSAADVRQHVEAASLDRGVLLQVQSVQGGTNFVLLRTAAKE